MELLYLSEHLSCRNYGQPELTENPLIQVVKIVKGKRVELSAAHNEIVFITDGRIRYYFRNLPAYEGTKGHIIFRPSGDYYSYEAQVDSTAVVFRLENPILLFRKFSIDKLCGWKGKTPDNAYESKRFGILEINSRIWHLLDEITTGISDGLKCRQWFEAKVNELLIYLRAYYTEEEIRDFFFLILSGDADFSEYVRLNWERFRSVNELAKSLNLSRRQFFNRFVKTFGTPPYRWMQEGKAKKVYQEIMSTDKPFKRIALESGFPDNTALSRFCRKEFGYTPTVLRKQEGHKWQKQ